MAGTGLVARSRLMHVRAAWRHWNCSSYFRLEVWNRFLNSQIRLAALISFKVAEYNSTLLPASWILDLASLAGKTMNTAIVKLVDPQVQKCTCELTGTKSANGKTRQKTTLSSFTKLA